MARLVSRVIGVPKSITDLAEQPQQYFAVVSVPRYYSGDGLCDNRHH